MINHYNKFDRISDWQIYLQQEVLVHPAWRSYPKIKDLEINPHTAICVGYWEGGNTQPAANELLGSGSISDLLWVVKNPKTFEGLFYKPSGIGKGGKSSARQLKWSSQFIFDTNTIQTPPYQMRNRYHLPISNVNC